ncbi:hypothetical protein FOXB_01004 [Fusarium oxysporum f. sp. conglutinans Fo5176]|uniref:SnoaL-like domain-containing protein n=1 Tax=Fusarium oxysporum (strain Fo5176) TaxID=660025 RepID=F9F3M9_FUSOF|nr:hypothetical protein FOXB_01004 [Fusarium oxysporum f. sp. conglutinans Fo5176]
MKCSAIFPLGLILGAARAINMTDYAPTCGIDREFKRWYRELLGAFEDPTTTDSITSFFAPGGALILGGSNFTGGEAILAARGAILPADRSIQWNFRLDGRQNFERLTGGVWHTDDNSEDLAPLRSAQRAKLQAATDLPLAKICL